MAKGEVRTQTEGYAKYVGIENFKVVAVNPDKEELGELLGAEIDTEPVYTGKKDKDGNPMSTISIWAKGETIGEIFPIRFTLIDKERWSTKNPENQQFINQVGISSYADGKENLPDWFLAFIDKKTKVNQGDKTVRAARVGEEELYGFIRSYLHNINYSKPSADILYNFDDLMNGDVEQMKKDFNSDFAGTAVGVAVVRNVEKDGEIKQYQGVSTKAFLPGSLFKYFNLGSFPGWAKKSHENFIGSFLGEHGEKAFFSLDLIHPYDKEEDLTASNSTKKEIADNNISY